MTTEELDELRLRLLTQDNRMTAHPIFVVFEKRRICGLDSDYSDDYFWRTSDGVDVADAEEAAALDLIRWPNEKMINGVMFEKVYYLEVNRFVTVCFTQKGAEAYLSNNGHNLRNPFIYVDSLYRNREMIELRNHLMAAGFQEGDEMTTQPDQDAKT